MTTLSTLLALALVMMLVLAFTERGE